MSQQEQHILGWRVKFLDVRGFRHFFLDFCGVSFFFVVGIYKFEIIFENTLNEILLCIFF